MRLTPEVHLVGSGDSGFGLTDPFDCHVYLLDGGSEAALVDAGIGTGVDEILANARAAARLRPKSVV
jgi:hydroxyacylglutathione hydrolase